MSLAGIEHPIAGDLSKIVDAFDMGMSVDGLPPHIKVGYTNAFEDKEGCAMLRIADWERENIAALTVPTFSDPGSPAVKTFAGEEKVVGARIVIRDFLGRQFGVNQKDGQPIPTPFAQVDVLDEGLLFVIEPSDLVLARIFSPDQEEYEIHRSMVMEQASLGAIYALAVEFLDAA